MYEDVLIIGEVVSNNCHRINFELLGKGRQLAAQLSCSLSCLILSDKCADLPELNKHGADTVYFMKSKYFAKPEEYLFKTNIVKFIEEKKPAVVLIGATHLGRSMAPRMAAALKTGLTADCTDLRIDVDGKLIQVRPAFSDNILAHIMTNRFPQIATIRYREFPEGVRDEAKPEHVEILMPYVTEYDSVEIIESGGDQGIGLADAMIVVSGGRGFRKQEDLKLLKELADSVGGMVGYSRALVDAGMAESKYQIGYSGTRVKPDLYIACGISGAPQHLAGMKESKKIIAINSDPSAPIFNICDYGYVGDLYQVIPRLIGQFSPKRVKRQPSVTPAKEVCEIG